MTTATMTPHETIRYAGAVLQVALPLLEAMPVPTDRQGIVNALKAGFALVRLDRALENNSLIATGQTSWECFYPWLADEDDPHEAALAKAAGEAGACAEALITAMTRCGIRVPDEAAGGAR